MIARLFAVLVVGVATAAGAASIDPWSAWRRDLERTCPSHHVDWIGGGDYDDLLTDFVSSLPGKERSDVEGRTDFSRLCVSEEFGFDCEMSVSLSAFQWLGLMHRFAEFGCKHYRCEAETLCSGGVSHPIKVGQPLN